MLLGLTGPPWALALSSQGPLGEFMGELLESLSQREAFQEGQGTTANSNLFALHELPGAQAPFLVNILDGRPKNKQRLSPGTEAVPRAPW